MTVHCSVNGHLWSLRRLFLNMQPITLIAPRRIIRLIAVLLRIAAVPRALITKPRAKPPAMNATMKGSASSRPFAPFALAMAHTETTISANI